MSITLKRRTIEEPTPSLFTGQSLVNKLAKGITDIAKAPITIPKRIIKFQEPYVEAAFKPTRFVSEKIGEGYEAIPEAIKRRILPTITPGVFPTAQKIERQFIQKPLLQTIGSAPIDPVFLGTVAAGISPRVRKGVKLPRNLNKLSNEELWSNFKGNIGGLRSKLTKERFGDFFDWMRTNVQPQSLRQLPTPETVGKPELQKALFKGAPTEPITPPSAPTRPISPLKPSITAPIAPKPTPITPILKPPIKPPVSVGQEIPTELQPFAERAKQLPKDEFIQKYNAGLKAQNLTTRDTAKNIDKLIKQSGFKNVEDFYDKVVTPTPSKGGEIEPIEELIEEAKKYKSAEEFAIKKFSAPDKEYALEEFFEKGNKLNADGTVDLYHATTKEKASEIIKSGILKKPEDAPETYGIYVSTSPDVAKSYGDGTLVKIRVPFKDLNLDDSFPKTSRMDFQITTKKGSYKPQEVGFELTPKSQLTDIWNKAQTTPSKGGEIEPVFKGQPIESKDIRIFEPQPLKPFKVKKQIREVTGQIKVGELIREDIALKRALQREQQISKQVFKAGEMAGIEKEKIHIAGVKERAEQRKDIKYELNKMVSDINRLPTENLPLDYKDKIEEIKSGFDLKKRMPKTIERRESMRQFVERMKEQGEEINIPEEKLDLLDKKTLNDMTMDELRDVHQTIMRLYHQGRLKNKLLTSQQNKTFEQVKNEGVQIITQGKGITEETPIVRALREKNKNLKTASLDAIKTYITIHLRPELMIDILDNYTKGVNTATIWNPMIKAENSKLIEANKTLETIQGFHKNIDIGKTILRKQKIGRFENMTKDNAMFIYANSFNDANRAHLYGSGVTDKDIADIEAFLSPQEKQAIKATINFYDTYQYPALDKVYSGLEGVHLGKEDNYFPIDRLEDISFNKELEKNILERNYVRRPGVSKEFTKERISSSKGFSEFSYFNTIFRNWGKVEHYKAFAKTIRDVNKYLSNPEIKTAIQQKIGERYYIALEKWLKDVSYGGDQRALSSLDTLSKWLRTNYVVSVLGLNLTTVLKQPVSYLQGAEMAGKAAVINATGKFITNPMKWIKFVKDKSPMMKHRGFSQERELREIISQRGLQAKFTGKTRIGYQKIREGSMMPILAADRATTTCVWLGAYDKKLKETGSEDQAIQWADKVIRRTQPMGGTMFLPDIFRGPEYQKLYTMFKNQLNQNFNLTYELYSKFGKGKMSFKDFVSGNIFYLLVPAFLIGLISRKKAPTVSQFIWDTVNQTTGSLFLLGNITSSLASGYWGDITPIEGATSQVQRLFQGKKPETKMKAGARLAGIATGLPIIGPEKILRGQPIGKMPEESVSGRTYKPRTYGQRQFKKRVYKPR